MSNSHLWNKIRHPIYSRRYVSVCRSVLFYQSNIARELPAVVEFEELARKRAFIKIAMLKSCWKATGIYIRDV